MTHSFVLIPLNKQYNTLRIISTSSYLLRLVDWLGHGEEGAVGQDGQHHQVVKILVHRNVDSSLPQLKFRNGIYKSSIIWVFIIIIVLLCCDTQIAKVIH